MEREDKQEKYEVEKRKSVNYKIQINDEGRKLKVLGGKKEKVDDSGRLRKKPIDIKVINLFTGGGAIMQRAHAAFCGRRCKIATTYGFLRYPEATVRYGREKCQDTTLRPKVPPLSNVPDRKRLLKATMTSTGGSTTTIASTTTKPAPPPLQTFNVTRVAGRCS